MTKPEEEETEESPLKAKKNVFIHDEEHAWLPARILEQTEDDAVVQVFDLNDDGTMKISPTSTVVQLRDYPPQNSLPLKNVNEYGDMIDLPFLHEPGILYNLRSRFFHDQPYTRTGDILIAVNPYQWLSNIYTTEKRKLYMPEKTYDPASGMVKKTMDPHVYEISAMAFRGLAVDKKNQSILVSGESGAGKTETVKICLDHIATIQGGLKRPGALGDKKQEHQVMSSIVQRVVDSNPLLEAFGNAKTVRNDNSSRFGKFVQLQFDQSASADANNNNSYNCNLVGSHIEVYLLEKSRVVTHAFGERNFHIFYQLLGASDELKTMIDADVLIGKTPASFPYLGSRDERGMKVRRRGSTSIEKSADAKDSTLIDSMSDAQWFEQTIKELAIIGIKDEILLMLMRALCVVLQLGTIKFVPDSEDNAMISPKQTSAGGDFDKLANLMGIESDVLSKAFCNKTIMAGSAMSTETVTSPISPKQAEEGCNAYAKDLYSKIFSYLVGTINAATSASAIHAKGKNSGIPPTFAKSGDDSTTQQEHGMIGVLDIFGFEAFEKNQFEQLCINYANERLQYMFASNVFVSLIDEYTREGLVVDFSYETNTNVLNLIAGKVGILATLNEECIRPGGSDLGFVHKALDQNKSSPRMFKMKDFTRDQFGVKHYAGPVIYTAKGFLSTNKDIMPMDLQKVSRSSSNTIIAAEYAEPVDSSGKQKRVPRSKTNMVKNTVASKFRTQLNSLLKTLSSTQTRYIRCIKPNKLKQPRIMENMEILRQLQSGGVIAAIKIASASYPNKMEHHAVLKRFRNLADKPDPSQDVKTQVSTLLATALKDFVSPVKGGTPRPPATLGKTRTYFRTGALEYLENGRNENIGFFAIIIQRNYRMAPARKSFLRQRKAAVVAQAIMRGFVWKRRVERMPKCALMIQCWARCVLAKIKLKRHKSAAKIQRRWCLAREVIRFERRTKAAIDIQKLARGSIQRPKFQKELAQKTSASILVQKVTRGYIQFIKFRAILERKRLMEKKAATQIQTIFRGHTLRRKFKAAIQIQRIARGCSQRIKFKIALEQDKARKNKAATHIQKTARGYIQHLKYLAMKKAEEERIAAEKKAEEERIAAEKAAEEARLEAERLAAEKAAEAERLAAEKAAEEARLKAEKLAEEKRIAAEKRAEEERLAAEKLAEEERLAAEKRAEDERIAATKRAEEERLAAEKRAEEERLAAEKRAEKERLAAERRAEKERLAAEKRAEKERRAAAKRAEKARRAAEKREAEEAERLAEEERLAAEKRAEEERLEAERAAAEKPAIEDFRKSAYIEAERLALEERLAAAERLAEEERLKAEKLAAENASLEDRIKYAQRRASEENDEIERAIQAAQQKAANDNAIIEEPDKDEELALAMEMALLAGQNPELAPEELNKLLGKPVVPVNAEPSGGGFFGRMVGGFGRLANKAAAPAPVVTGAPWKSSGPPSLGQFLANSGGRSVANSGGRSRGGWNDDDTIAESVVTMMLPDSLTADELRSRRVDLKMHQDIRKLKKQISEKNRELRKLRTRGNKRRGGNKEKKSVIEGRHESASVELDDTLQRLLQDDADSEVFTAALEEASIALGLGSLEDQKKGMGEEESLRFDVQVLQEAQLVRQMRSMHATGLQKFLHKKHTQKDVEYLKSCKAWLSDSSDLKVKMQKLEASAKEMKKLYEETLWRQEAAFARHDPNMTIRETIEDLF